MKIALLGLPHAGKKTLFSLLTGHAVSPSRKPGDAIEGTAPVFDPRLPVLAEICHPERVVYAQNEFVLCPDVPFNETSREWLDSAQRCDLLCLVTRAFDADGVYHPAGSVDAARDLEYVRGELLLADMATIDKRLERLAKEKRAGLRPEQQVEENALAKCMAALDAGQTVADAPLDPPERAALRSLELVSRLPILSVYNVGEAGIVGEVAANALRVSCAIEADIMSIEDEAERREFLESLGLDASGLDRVNAAAYDALGLMSFYTIGEDECRAWPIRKGSTAPVAGGRIHTDIQRGFIRVEVIKYDDLLAAGSEAAVRQAGKMQAKGKDYIMEDGDICHFLFKV